MLETDLQKLNEEFKGLSPEDRVRRTAEEFDLVMATSSFGYYSAVMAYIIHKTVPDMPIMTIDNRNLTSQTEYQRNLLKGLYHLNLHIYDMQPGETKRDTLERGILELVKSSSEDPKTVAWISGVMHDETEERRDFDFVMLDTFGTGKNRRDIVKIHPILDWGEERAKKYVIEHSLPVNPDYVDPDRPEKSECGLHTGGLCRKVGC